MIAYLAPSTSPSVFFQFSPQAAFPDPASHKWPVGHVLRDTTTPCQKVAIAPVLPYPLHQKWLLTPPPTPCTLACGAPPTGTFPGGGGGCPEAVHFLADGVRHSPPLPRERYKMFVHHQKNQCFAHSSGHPQQWLEPRTQTPSTKLSTALCRSAPAPSAAAAVILLLFCFLIYEQHVCILPLVCCC